MRTVVITGASSGIGRDAALHFNQLGYRVFAGVRTLDDGRQVAAASADPAHCVPLQLDVTDASQVLQARDTVLADVGPQGLTALISNAGIAALSGAMSCEECPLETQQRVMDVNHFGAVRVIQAFLPLLRAAQGTVVVNTALMAHTVIPFNAGYAASKCAMEGWVDSLRREVAPAGVRVAMIEAGYISSDLERKQHADAEFTSAIYPAEASLPSAMAASADRFANSPSASPRRMSEAMARAVDARKPKPRHIVGTGARAIWTVGCLPDRTQDTIFRVAMSRMARRVAYLDPRDQTSTPARPSSG